ncbi:C_GCAxxG_C_C family probable redox protein [Desulfoscipio gibsoniae DSM 7213]|uniref:C_GCAxxG_C_C family probable redox protein n=2 Tax=Desulfoscipio gibsoniae TaxID=102134 RepID=R4KGH4_9FIRM|nr:DV_1555 family C-GCAxxG-C-C protein [Desulfoscipio gibsoniae]AGL02313.1 C_GCAxxG_C_C family probable redox protein [Desulfoscipio gibsoniae DSM 7213]
MSDELLRMLELYRQGFNCSQILLSLGLETRGYSNPDLVRAMSGLGGGLGFSGKTCGALIGGVCLLGLYAGRGTTAERENDRFLLMVEELVQWFEDETGRTYGGIDCADIIGERLAYKTAGSQCANIISSTYARVKEILISNGIDPAG